MPSSHSHARRTNARRRNVRNDEIGLEELRRHIENTLEENNEATENSPTNTPEEQQSTPFAKERM